MNLILRCPKCKTKLVYTTSHKFFWCKKCLKEYTCKLVNDEIDRSFFRGLSSGKFTIVRAIINILKHPEDVS
jgi:uncharacterized Zn ribbon protein